jgi:hypothetical protein
MKILKIITGAAILGGILTLSSPAFAADQGTPGSAKAAKPYTLKTCIVSGEKLGGDMGDPFVFVQDGQQIKLCCKDCKPKFDKEPAKYLKKLADAEKAAADAKPAAPAHNHASHQH